MSKEKVIMKDETTQTEVLNTTTSSKDSHHSSPRSNESLENVHDKAYNYLESLEKKYSKEIISNMYSNANLLIEKLYEAPDFTVGFQEAIKEYRLLKDKDNDSFILIQFLEDFYGRFTMNEYYTQEMHENNFKYGSSLAHEVNQELIGEIYGIHGNEY
jgi:hypothetical protein